MKPSGPPEDGEERVLACSPFRGKRAKQTYFTLVVIAICIIVANYLITESSTFGVRSLPWQQIASIKRSSAELSRQAKLPPPPQDRPPSLEDDYRQQRPHHHPQTVGVKGDEAGDRNQHISLQHGPDSSNTTYDENYRFFDCYKYLFNLENTYSSLAGRPVGPVSDDVGKDVATKKKWLQEKDQPQQQQMQQNVNFQKMEGLEENFRNKWCGREIESQNSSRDSFAFLSRWLSTGGINVIELLQKSNFSCPISCPHSTAGGFHIHVYDVQNNRESTGHRLQNEKVFLSSRLSKLERDLLKSAVPITDFRKVPNENSSKVIILSSIQNLTIGDTVSVRIDMYDDYGQAMHRGGDDVRVWIHNPSTGSGSPGHVINLYNGSYLANVTVRWEGEQNLSVALHHPREIIRTLVFLRYTLGTMRYLTSAFEKDGEGEETLCMWYPVIPGYSKICNLTSLNGGLPWYCGKPVNKKLTCADWVRAQAADFVSPLPVTKAEQAWIDKMNRAPYIRLLQSPGPLYVKGSKPTAPLKRCKRIRYATTWFVHQPSGWFRTLQWKSSYCNSRVVGWGEKGDWLRNKSVYLIGDSNMKNLFTTLRRAFCTINDEDPPFPGPMNCTNPVLNASFIFKAHAHPFNLPHPDHYRIYNKPISQWLREIPDTQNVLIIIHLYLHYAQFTLPLYKLHVGDAYEGVTELLRRRPGARVAIRGTHVSHKGWPVHGAGGDVMADQFNDLLIRKFRPIRDKVMYLNGWDMTLAVGNLNFHPEKYVDEAMINHIFDVFMGRD